MGSVRYHQQFAIGIFVFAMVWAGILWPSPTSADPGDPPTINVVGGREASPGQFPHIVSLQDGSFHYCGGDLIAPAWVVTAAHCVVGETPSAVTVVLGEHNRSIQEPSEQRISASRIIIHPNYNNLNNDVALVQLSREATLNDRVKTIPLATSADSAYYAHGWPATVAGWGNTRYGGSSATILQYAQDAIYDNTSTSCTLRNDSRLTSNMVCWGGSSVISACNGDSGGPLVINVNGTWKLLGKVSWGYNCAGSTAYTKLPNYVSWISQYVGGTTPTPSTRTPTPVTSTPIPSPNLALGRPVTVSSIESSSYPGSNAVDGNSGTRWASLASDPQWIQIDLGRTAAINRVRLNWEVAYARAYQIQLSNDAVTWTTIFSTSSGDGGIDDLNISGTGRYLRVYCTVRGTPYVYSLWEVEAYGLSTTPTPTPLTRTPTPLTITPTSGTGTIFADDFEINKGWISNPEGTDTATNGRWERGDPEATDYNGPKQLGTTTSGVNDLVTGRLAGAGSGDYDLDGGLSSIRSPSILLPSSSNLTLSLRYYLAYSTNSSTDDYFRIRIVGSSGTTTVFERRGAAADVDAAWQTATASLNSYAGQSIRIQIEAADAATGSLLEAAVDDIRITW